MSVTVKNLKITLLVFWYC